VCDLETSRMGASYIYIYIYDISRLRVKLDQDGQYLLQFCLVYFSHLLLKGRKIRKFNYRPSFIFWIRGLFYRRC